MTESFTESRTVTIDNSSEINALSMDIVHRMKSELTDKNVLFANLKATIKKWTLDISNVDCAECVLYCFAKIAFISEAFGQCASDGFITLTSGLLKNIKPDYTGRFGVSHKKISGCKLSYPGMRS